jgi:DNA-binding beta-propeller fold protein YncE
MGARPWRAAAVLPAIVTLLSCADAGDPEPAPVPAGLVVTAPDSVMTLGQVAQFTATYVDSTGTPIPGGRFTWESMFPPVASVTSTGLVTATGVGLGMILASTDSFTGAAAFEVIDSLITTRLPILGAPFGLAVAGATAYVTLAFADSLAILDFPAERRLGAVATGDVPTSVAVNSAGTRAYVTDQFSEHLSTFSLPTNTPAGGVTIPGSPYVTLTSANDGTVWVTSGSLDRVYAVNTTTLAIVDSAPTPAGPNGLARHPTLARLYVSGSFDGNVYELDATTLDSLRSWSLGGSAQGMVVSTDGTTLFVANEAGWIDVITLSNGAVGTPVVVAGSPFGLALSPDGVRLAVSSANPGSVVVFNAASRTVLRTVRTGGVPRRLAYRSDGTRLLVTNESGWVDFIR